MNEELILVEDLETLKLVRDYLSNTEFEYVAVDTETTGLTKDADIIGYSFSCEEHIGIYVVLAYWDKEKQELIFNGELKAASHDLLSLLKTKKIIMHNSPFDCEVIDRAFGIQLMPYVHTDTMELWHLLDENNSCGLKEVGERLFGGNAKAEQLAMKESVKANGGKWVESGKGRTKEMYKADKDLLGNYAAKDTILTYKIFQEGIPRLFEGNLDGFYYEDESMPLMRGPTYQLNTTGLKVDILAMKDLQRNLMDECQRLTREIEELTNPYIDDSYPFKDAKGKTKPFSISSNQQLAWLLFIKLENVFNTLTDGGRELAKELCGKVPYSNKEKRDYIQTLQTHDKQPHKYMQCDYDTLELFKDKYEWVDKLLQLRSADKVLTTYVEGILRQVNYGVIYPSFKQHGTTSGRYSSSNPNFQNLPRDDKRIKACIVSRPGKVFVGADYSQLEPRVFASVSQDKRLMECFEKGEDFYSVVGIPIFGKEDTSSYKNDLNAFATKYPDLRNFAKAFALATAYGTSAFQQARILKRSQVECQSIIDRYFEAYPAVEAMMLTQHEIAKRDGVVHNLYGRPRRIPEATRITTVYGNFPHGELPYEARTLLNLGMNHKVQSSAATIVNRAMISFYNWTQKNKVDAKIVLQVHDEIIVECNEKDAEKVSLALKDAMEKTTTLPGVKLVTEPKIAKNLADLK